MKRCPECRRPIRIEFMTRCTLCEERREDELGLYDGVEPMPPPPWERSYRPPKPKQAPGGPRPSSSPESRLRYQAAKAAKRRRWRDEGRCQECGAPADGMTRCPRHRAEQAASYQRRKARAAA